MSAEPTAAVLQPLAGPAASLTEQALDAIREAAHTGVLRPGQLYAAYRPVGPRRRARA